MIVLNDREIISVIYELYHENRISEKMPVVIGNYIHEKKGVTIDYKIIQEQLRTRLMSGYSIKGLLNKMKDYYDKKLLKTI